MAQQTYYMVFGIVNGRPDLMTHDIWFTKEPAQHHASTCASGFRAQVVEVKIGNLVDQCHMDHLEINNALRRTESCRAY